MPVNHISLVPAAQRAAVRDLAIACINQFAAIRGPGNGVGNGSCCAAVRLPAPNDHEFRFGQSQAHLLDADAPDAGGLFNPANHAERQAHAAGTLAGGYQPHLFVELPPCAGVNGCANWCANNIPAVNVWYMYPDTQTMVDTHAGGVAAEMVALDTWIG